MDRPYKLTLETPTGEYSLDGESLLDIMLQVLPVLAARLDNYLSRTTTVNALELALQTLNIHKAKQSRGPQTTSVAQAGLELQLIECYLRGMRIMETVQWMKTEKRFDISKSAVGRYWVRLRRLGIYPEL